MAQKNTKPPSCIYMPNPPYTQPAREAKANGNLQLDAIITTEGMVVKPENRSRPPFRTKSSFNGHREELEVQSGHAGWSTQSCDNSFEMNFRLH
jgi:hypothetical protein